MPIPVTMDDAKRQLRMDVDDVSRDDEIQSFIDDAAAWIEEYTGHVLVERDITAEFATFGEISFREWPIAASAVPIISYQGASGPAVSITDVQARVSRRPVRIVRWDGARWPVLPSGNIVTVTIRAGYPANAVVPPVFRRAMLMLIAAYDDDREGGDIVAKAEATARRICAGFRPRAL
jgi:phage conserved hypothetical protein, phiE125 gp8 family